MKRHFTLLFFALVSVSLQAQKNKTVIIHDTVKVAVVSKASADSLQKEYIEILKNSNEQLNNYWTPVNWSYTFLSILVGILGLLFAGGSVWAGFFIYRQGQDFRNQRDELFKGFTKDKTTLLNAAKQDFKEKLDEVLKNIDDDTAEQIKNLTTKYANSMESINGYNNYFNTRSTESIYSQPIPAPTPTVRPPRAEVRCSKCDHVEVTSFPSGTTVESLKGASISLRCPICNDNTLMTEYRLV